MHNIQTLRGARTRDARNFARYLDETLERANAEVDCLMLKLKAYEALAASMEVSPLADSGALTSSDPYAGSIIDSAGPRTDTLPSAAGPDTAL